MALLTPYLLRALMAATPTPPKRLPCAGSRWRCVVAAAVLAVPLSSAWGQAPATRAVDTQGPEFTAQLVYQLLLAEIQAANQDGGAAYSLMLDAAQRTQQAALFRRTVDLALQARAGNSALAAASEWATAHPDSDEPYRYQLQILLALNRPAEISVTLRNVIRLTSATERNDVIAAIPHTLSRTSDKAAALMAARVALRPSIADRATAAAAWSAIGRMELDNQDVVAALASAYAAVQAQPDSDAAVLLALELLDVDVEAAQQLVLDYLAQPSVHATPVYAQVMLQYVRVLIDARRYTDSLAQLQQLTRHQPKQAEAWLFTGIVQNELRLFSPATTALKRYLALASELPPDQAERGQTQAYLQLASIAEAQKKWAQANQWLNRIESTDGLLTAQIRRATLLGRQGHVAQARELIRQQPERAPEDARRKLVAEAQLLRELQRHNDAYEVYGMAAQQYPDDPNLMYEQAMSAEAAGRHERMENVLRVLMVRHPDFYHAYNALGYALADRNERLDEAKSLIQRALAASPNNAFILDSMGWVYFRLGQLELAAQYLQQAFHIMPDAEVAAHLGEVLWAQSDTEAAKRLWREGLLLDPTNTTLVNTLQRLGVKP